MRSNKESSAVLDKQEVLDRLNIQAYFDSELPGIRWNGNGEGIGLCCFHEDTRASLSVNYQKGCYYCHACGAKGGLFDFHMKRHNVDFKTAIQELAKQAGVTSKPQQPERIHVYYSESKQPLYRKLIFKNGDNKSALFERYKDGQYIKGLQGIERTLYNLHKLKESSSKVVFLSESEKDCDNLTGLDLIAVSSGGAESWKPEFAELLRGRQVSILPHNDPAGRKYAETAARYLQGKAASIRVVDPSIFGMAKGADISNWLEARKAEGKTSDDIRAGLKEIVKAAPEYIKPEKQKPDTVPMPGAEFPYISPENFTIYENGISQISYVKDEPIEKTVIPQLVLITGRAMDIDLLTEDIEISFKRDNRTKKLWVSKTLAADAKKIIEPAGHGLAVNSSNSRKVVEYLSGFEAANIGLIPKKHITRGLGWKTLSDRKIYIHSESSEEQIQFAPEPGFERFVRALHSAGRFEVWREAIRDVMSYPPAAFAIFAALAAPLLRLLNAPNFIVDYHGLSSTGKTTALSLAASIWGNPVKENGGLVMSWNSTKIFIERLATFANDFPICLDDSQTEEDALKMKVLYMLANGIARGRGSLTGVRQTSSWHTVCLSSGERALTESTHFAGAKARTISIYGTPFPTANSTFVNGLKSIIAENFGHAGPFFVKHISRLWNDFSVLKAARDEYRSYQAILSREANNEIGDRLSHYFASIKVAADLACESLDIADKVDAEEVIYKVFSRTVSDNQEGDMLTKAMEHVLSWVSANEKSFMGMTPEEFGIKKEGEYIGIHSHKLSEVLSKERFPERVVLRGWIERSWIKKETENTYTCARRVKRPDGTIKTVRFVLIPWGIMQEFIEK